jgi:hypothetical protein
MWIMTGIRIFSSITMTARLVSSSTRWGLGTIGWVFA